MKEWASGVDVLAQMMNRQENTLLTAGERVEQCIQLRYLNYITTLKEFAQYVVNLDDDELDGK